MGIDIDILDVIPPSDLAKARTFHSCIARQPGILTKTHVLACIVLTARINLEKLTFKNVLKVEDAQGLGFRV